MRWSFDVLTETYWCFPFVYGSSCLALWMSKPCNGASFHERSEALQCGKSILWANERKIELFEMYVCLAFRLAACAVLLNMWSVIANDNTTRTFWCCLRFCGFVELIGAFRSTWSFLLCKFSSPRVSSLSSSIRFFQLSANRDDTCFSKVERGEQRPTFVCSAKSAFSDCGVVDWLI